MKNFNDICGTKILRFHTENKYNTNTIGLKVCSKIIIIVIFSLFLLSNEVVASVDTTCHEVCTPICAPVVGSVVGAGTELLCVYAVAVTRSPASLEATCTPIGQGIGDGAAPDKAQDICNEVICQITCQNKPQPECTSEKCKIAKGIAAGAINFSTIEIYGFGNTTNYSEVTYIQAINQSVPYNASDIFKLALQIPKEQYFVSIYHTIYCSPGINNTELCEILLDADYQTKVDFTNDIKNNTGNITTNIKNELENQLTNITNNVGSKWWNDERIMYGYNMMLNFSIAFQGRVVTTSNGIKFREGENKRILVENQSLNITYYLDKIYLENLLANDTLYEKAIPQIINFTFDDPDEETQYGLEYRQYIADLLNNYTLPFMKNYELQQIKEIWEPIEKYKINFDNNTQYKNLRNVHVTLGLAQAMKEYNIPKPSFIDNYNSGNKTGLTNSNIPNASKYNITIVGNLTNGVNFSNIPLYRTGYISEEEFIPKTPLNTTKANWTIFIGNVSILGTGNNILLYTFTDTDVIFILPKTLPELTLGNWSISYTPNESIKAGDQVTINTTIFNFGTKNATNVLIRFYDGNPSSGGILIGSTTINVFPLWSNDTAITWTASAGEHNIYVVVDSDNIINEINESNNMAYKTITVEQTVRNYSWSDLYSGYVTCNNPIYSADDGYVQVTLSQPFKFYDKEYSTFYIGTNGYITFDGGSYQYWDIPQMLMNTKMIGVDAGDLVSTIHICSTSNGLVIRWQGSHYGQSDNVDVQAILYSNGNMKTNLNSVGSITGVTGVSRGDGKYYTSLTTNNNLSYGLSSPYGNYSSIDSYYGYVTCNNPIYSADDGYVQVTLSQPFKFYDKEYSTFYIGTNGYITFDGGSWQWYNIPQMFMGTKMIAVDAGDLVSTIHICSTSNGLVIRWHGSHYGQSDNVDVQAILYSNGNMKTNLNSVGSITGVTGVSRGDGKYYTSLTINNNLSYCLFKPPNYSIK